LSVSYWITLGFSEEMAQKINYLYIIFDYNGRVSLYYCCCFLVAIVPTIINTKSWQIINIVYRRQLKLIFAVTAFVFTAMFNELFLPDGTIVEPTLFLLFILCFSLLLLSEVSYFNSDNTNENDKLINALMEQNRAVVITTPDRKICYTNAAFTTMTGYYQREVLGKKPSLLQGKLTTQQSIENVKRQLVLQTPFEEDIINYRKDGEVYVCRVAISPIFHNKILTHFVAYEEDLGVVAQAEMSYDDGKILEQLHEIFTNDCLYTNKNLQLSDVSELLNMSSRQLSQLINKHQNQTFIDFVNGYRVNAIISALNANAHHTQTLEVIGNANGFNSKSSFFAAFKKVTGQTPGTFIQSIEI
jgi:PAS domain S-box-containing protein